MSLYKNGIWEDASQGAHWNHFYEAGAWEIYAPQSSSYTPTAGGTNICISPWTINFYEVPFYNAPSGAYLTIRVEVDVEFSGFDSSNTDGTFAMRWQGSSYNINNEAWEWTTSSPVANALNNQQSLTTLVNGKNGTYHYNNFYSIPASWLQTYSKTSLGIRTDYSNGIGSITIKNLKVYPEVYYGREKVKLSEYKTTSANNFIEI